MEPVEQARVMPARDDKYLTICLDVPLVRKQNVNLLTFRSGSSGEK
jgi:hypothetical protein